MALDAGVMAVTWVLQTLHNPLRAAGAFTMTDALHLRKAPGDPDSQNLSMPHGQLQAAGMGTQKDERMFLTDTPLSRLIATKHG